MKELFDTLNEIWRAIDLALIAEQTAEQRRHRIALAKSVMMTLPADNALDVSNSCNAASSRAGAVGLFSIARGREMGTGYESLRITAAPSRRGGAVCYSYFSSPY